MKYLGGCCIAGTVCIALGIGEKQQILVREMIESHTFAVVTDRGY